MKKDIAKVTAKNVIQQTQVEPNQSASLPLSKTICIQVSQPIKR